MQRSESISVPVLLAIAAVAVEFCISANFLTWIGVAYVTDGGSLLEKIHPGSYLLCIAFMARAASQRRPNAVIWTLCGSDARLLLYFSCLASCLIYMLFTTGSGNVIVLLDTFLSAGMLACVIQDASPRELHVLLGVFRCGVCLNCVLALGEGIAHATLVPLYLNDVGYHAADGEFRPTGFYDHPLTGATMTLMGLPLAPSGRLRRWAYLALATAALIAFGGRVAIAAAAAGAVSCVAMKFVDRVLHRDRWAMRVLLTYCVASLACAVMVITALEAGFGDRLLGHLYWDPSAQIRVAQWSLLGKLDAWQLVFGTARRDLLALLTPLWLQSGVEVIENFWLLMFVSLGIVGFPLFMLGFSALLAWCWQQTDMRGRVLLFSILIVLSTSNSLGRKSTLLVSLVAAIACLRENRPTADGRIGQRVAIPVFSHVVKAAG